jgi:hypothetical protein
MNKSVTETAYQQNGRVVNGILIGFRNEFES